MFPLRVDLFLLHVNVYSSFYSVNILSSGEIIDRQLHGIHFLFFAFFSPKRFSRQ